MEYALYVSDTKNLRCWSKKYSRLYFGVEFCERLLPSYNAMNSALRFAKNRNLNFTFVTPYATDKGIKTINRLLRFIKKKSTQPVEVVFNDAGTLNILKEGYPQFIRVQGRLRTFYHKGIIFSPLGNHAFNRMILPLLNKIRVKKEKHAYLAVEKVKDLKSQGISRVEMDAPVMTQSFSITRLGIPVSLYVPYSYITTTRYCPIALSSKKSKIISVVNKCSFPCVSGHLILHSRSMIKPILLRGAAYFYENHLKERKIKNVDRIVYQPVLPY